MAGSVNLGTVYASLDLRLNRLEAGMVKAKSDFDKLGGDLNKRAEKMKVDLGQKFGEIGRSLTLGITAPLAALGTAAIKAAVDMDSLKRGLRAVSGSGEETERQLVRLREVAKLPGLGFSEAIAGSTRLQAAGLSAKTAERALLGFGNALATVGKGKAELDGVITALSQIQSKGVVSAEEINQIAERVPQIRRVMIDAFGTANTEIIQKAKITSQQFIEVMVDAMGRLPKAAAGAKDSFENFSDSAKRALAAIGDVFLPAVTQALDKVAPIIEGIAGSFKALPGFAQSALGGLAIGGAIMGPALLGLSSLATAIKTVNDLLKGSVIAKLLGIGSVGAAGVIGTAAIATGAVVYKGLSTPQPVDRLSYLEQQGRNTAIENARRQGPAVLARVQAMFARQDGRRGADAEHTAEMSRRSGLLRTGGGKPDAPLIDATARAAEMERKKKAAEERKRFQAEQAAALKQYAVDMATFRDKFNGLRVKAEQDFREKVPVIGMVKASDWLKERLKEIDSEQDEERKSLEEAKTRRIEQSKRREEQVSQAVLKMRKEHADREKEAVKAITDEAVVEWKQQQERLRAVQEIEDRLFNFGATDEQKGRMEAWRQYWRDFQVEPELAAKVLAATLDRINDQVMAKWEKNTATHFANISAGFQRLIGEIVRFRSVFDESVPSQVITEGGGNVDSEAGIPRRETDKERKDKEQRAAASKTALERARDKMKRSLGGMLGQEVAFSFADGFARTLEKAFGRSDIGKVFARGLMRWIDKEVGNAMDTLFDSIGGMMKRKNKTAGGGMAFSGIAEGSGGLGGGFGLPNMNQSAMLALQLGSLTQMSGKKQKNSLIGSVLGLAAGSLIPGLGLLGGASIGGFLGGLFADGGNPPIGKYSIVGERGPEIIKPRSAMTVIPNHQMGAALAGAGGVGGSSITVNMGGVTIGSGMDASDVGRRIAREIERKMPVRPNR